MESKADSAASATTTAGHPGAATHEKADVFAHAGGVPEKGGLPVSPLESRAGAAAAEPRPTDPPRAATAEAAAAGERAAVPPHAPHQSEALTHTGTGQPEGVGPGHSDSPDGQPDAGLPPGGDPPNGGRALLHLDGPINEHWNHIPDGADNPHYGQPLENPGTPPQVDLITDFNRDTWNLFRNPDELYGHDPHGNPLSLEGYVERYRELTPDGDIYDVYPPNDGAVTGTKWSIRSAEEYIKHFGAMLDRVGDPNGKYIGVVENGIPAFFEERGLPMSSLNQQYYQYMLTGKLPESWTIEVSEIAPAFGRDGGGLQLLIKNARGIAQRLVDLIREGVLNDLDGAIS